MRMPWVAAAALVGSVGMLTVSQINAQRPTGAQPPRDGIAILDMFAVVQSSTKIKQAKDVMMAEMETKKEALKKESERGKALAEKFRNMQPNNPDREKLEREILKMKADFELQGKKFERESQEKQTKVWYALSRDVQDELDRYAKANGIQLILRSDPAAQDLTDPRAVAQELSKLIVYQRGLDVSPTVIDLVNRRTPGGVSTAGAPAQSKPVQK
jgi:Skp family chaperone for outer membrane proteins